MKKVKQLDNAPPGLQHFLEQYPDERDWKVFKNYQEYRDNKNQRADKELIDALIEVQHGLCAYCEIDLTETPYDSQVEHFHPKCDRNNQINWTYKITNLFAACKGGTSKIIFGTGSKFYTSKRFLEPEKENHSCGDPKANKIPGVDIELLKPSELPLISLFSISRDGKINIYEHNCHQSGINSVQVENTIQELNLNCARLKDARMEVFEKIKDTFENEMVALGETATDAEIKDLQLRLAEQFLFEKNNLLGEFFTTIRSYFGLAAETILEKNFERWI
jgi:uncharacterized protein (TIGR02646 family)